MENLIISFNVVMPLFLCMALGYGLRMMGFVDIETINKINKLCFKVFLPIYLFDNIYQTDITAAFDTKLISFGLCSLLGIFGILMIFVPRIEKENAKRGVMVQAMFRSNFALFGLPVALYLCGEDHIGPTSLMVGIMVPMYNVLSVIVLEIFRGGKPSALKMVKSIAKNPLIRATLLGILAALIHFQMPFAFEKTVSDLGGVATPLSLVALGGSFTFSKVASNRRQLSIGLVCKLIINPMMLISLGLMLGFRNETLVPIMIMAGAPTAVSSFPMAQQMGGDGELAAEYVVFTSAFSILTIFMWTFVLKQGGFI